VIRRADAGRRRWLLAGLAVAAAGLTACTGIPTSSTPEVIQSVPLGVASGSGGVRPTQNADQREIVQEFLRASLSRDKFHTDARSFLTPEARNRWNDATTTVINNMQIGNFDPANSTVSVRGQVVGTVSASGVYTPVLQGEGSGGPTTTFSFGMVRNGSRQWRINSLQPGLLVQTADFQQTYSARNLYFWDLAGTHLIPDPRYTALEDPLTLSNWLVQQLIAGSRSDLQSVTATEAAQIDPQRAVVTIQPTQTSIELPGAQQLDADTRNYLAAQVADTLEQVDVPKLLVITDGGRPVLIPAAHSTVFALSNFKVDDGTSDSPPPLFFIRSGAVYAVNAGRAAPLPGPAGTGRYHLTSVAVAPDGSRDLYLAGTAPEGKSGQVLLVGTRAHGLHRTAVRGALTRPSWAPNLGTGIREVWVGAGGTVWRVSPTGEAHSVSLNPANGVLPGHVRALRLSPDGSRVAMVLAGAGAIGQLWVGSIARGASGGVSVVNLEQVSPQGVDLSDVAWYGPDELFAIGRSVTTDLWNSYEVQIDGSLWTQRPMLGLPQAPDTVTVAEPAFAWASAGSTVWEQSVGQWISPIGTNTLGTDPVYLE
jgi:hypothetical protein